DEEPYIEDFKTHIAQLKNEIEIVYDRESIPGADFANEINNNLEDADIIFLFISAHYFDSEFCLKEKTKAVKLIKQKGISVSFIVLSTCGWKDDDDIPKLLALTKDARKVSSYSDQTEAWYEIYSGLKKIIEKVKKIKQLEITEEFEFFLQDTEMLRKAHSKKERVLLDDIFVYPMLEKYDFSKKETLEQTTTDLNKLLKNHLDYPKIVIAGDNQSGKTTICKMMFKKLRDNNFVPVYVDVKKNSFKKKIEDTISNSFNQQYKGLNIKEIDNKRIIPIIDNFHFSKNKGKHIKDLSIYDYCIITVDDIFGINIEDEKYIGSFTRFKIKEFNSLLRDELIKKWVTLTDKEIRDNDIYKNVDKTTELIDNILGKAFGRGIMHAYPFFILTAMINYETLEKPIDQQITSQGYCYQALITIYLKKYGVMNEDIETYVNFLAELAFYIYKEKKPKLSPMDFNSFMNYYSDKFNLPIKPETLIKKLGYIISKDSFNNRSFYEDYLYFYFVAKYLSDHMGDESVDKGESVDKIIENILKNLQVDDNAYIAIFITHHSKNIGLLRQIEKIAKELYSNYTPATLTKDDVRFFDENANMIIDLSLPSADKTPEAERRRRLKFKDEYEESKEHEEQDDDDIDDKEIELRRSVKTVEVIGCIIKNRAGSLEKIELENIFKEAMYVHLRLLSSLFEVIKNEDRQTDMIDGISRNLSKIIEESEGKGKKPNSQELRKTAKSIFWNMNFVLTAVIIDKIVHSLGSDKLIGIVNEVCDKIDTPASLMVKQGILMWYEKNPQLNELEKYYKRKDFSKMAKKSTDLLLLDFCYVHNISSKDRQILGNKFGFNPRKFLPNPKKQ
ncbi:MAG: toll/interleukin-1 receptor domain-containing protein, partial [Methanobacterium paludis]|nr:toll/interleukin-1 receptor domain-containing protein [Methanobacterium paludis]